MRPPIRVLVVDDAVVVRRLLSEALAREPDMGAVATAPNGRIALAKLSQVPADVVVLNLELPDMDGLAALDAIHADHPDLPVVVFSATAGPGAGSTVDVLLRGAGDYVEKPRSDVEALARVVQDQLVPSIRQLAGDGPALGTRRGRAGRPGGMPAGTRDRRPGRSGVVVIGVSTGGPQALQALFERLPADLRAPVLIVQHMPPIFTGLLAERLSKIGTLPVNEAVAGGRVEHGRAWLAPGDWHMEVRAGRPGAVLALHQAPAVNSCRPSVDLLFASAAQVYGAGVLGVVLTGMGREGLRGAEAITAAGGRVLAQDAATSVVWGMPGAVAHAGLADAVLPLEAMADAIVERVELSAPSPAGSRGR